ncbi:helix-turn-helix domain-containing protein [Roseburia hominis]
MTGFAHELVMPNEDLPFKLFLFEGKDGNYFREKHWHRSVEIFAVLEGELDFYMNEEDTHLEAGEFVIVNSNEVHSIRAVEKNQTVVLQIPLKAFEAYYTDEQFICFTHGEREQDRHMMELVREMYETYEKKETGYELKVQSSYFMMMYLLVTKYRKMEVSPEIIRNRRNLNRLSSITNYIKDNYWKELSLDGVASVFGYSPTYLSRMFQKYAKTNYKAYLQSVRLEYAYKELMKTEHSIGEVAEHNGFADGRAFARAFRRKYGVLPSEYKKIKKCSS